mgnify:CR=1 FL=1
MHKVVNHLLSQIFVMVVKAHRMENVAITESARVIASASASSAPIILIHSISFMSRCARYVLPLINLIKYSSSYEYCYHRMTAVNEFL